MVFVDLKGYMKMKKRLFGCCLIFALGISSCRAEEKKTDTAISKNLPFSSLSYQDGTLSMVPFTTEKKPLDVYESSEEGNIGNKVGSIRYGEAFKTKNIESYFTFVDASGKKSRPFSYIYSYFGENVDVFTDGMDDLKIQEKIDYKYARYQWDEFGEYRYAQLFHPGEYDIETKIGYYTTVNGLGYSPEEVCVNSLRRDNNYLASGSLCNFWCGAENYTTKEDSVFHVSQATFLRRMNFEKNLDISDNGYSSGGFLADSRVQQKIVNVTQQQWFNRNVEMGKWTKSDINMVFSGCTGEIEDDFPNVHNTLIEKTKKAAEKPYLVFDEKKGYGVFVPSVLEDKVGVSWNDDTEGKFVPISKFYVAGKGDDSASLNQALSQKKHLLLTPGIYDIDKPLEIKTPDTIVLGIGMATLRSTSNNSDSIIVTEDVDGIRISGLLLDSGSKAETMLRIGKEKNDKDHASNPICLNDIFFRIGGLLERSTGALETMQINSNDVIGDNFWLWRADHGMDSRMLQKYMLEDGSLPSDIGEKTDYAYWKGFGVGWDNPDGIDNYSPRGAVIHGDRVELYGLMVEHFGKYQTYWDGEDGYMVFYQSETPYDAPNQDSWTNPDLIGNQSQGYSSHKVADEVTSHQAYGLGVYYVHNDTSERIVMDHAIEVPSNEGIMIYHAMIANFKSFNQSGIRHIVNQYGKGNLGNGNKNALTSFIAGKAIV